MLYCIAVCAFSLGALPGESLFLSAHDALRTGDYDNALEAFQACAGRYPMLAPFAQVYAARAEVDMGRSEAALARYGSLIEAEPHGPWTDMAFADLARLQRKRKAYAKAAALYRHVLNIAPRPWWMDVYAWENAECLGALPDREAEAYAHYRDVILNSGLIRPRLRAARLLVASPKAEDRALALLGMMRSSAYREAMKALPAAGLEWTDGAEAVETWPALAKAHGSDPWLPVGLLSMVHQAAEAGQYEKAEAAADLLIRHFPGTRDPADALWWLANYLNGKKRRDDAERIYLRIARECTESFRADDALVRVAERRAGRGDTAGALRHYAMLTEKFPESTFVTQAHTRCADLMLKQGDRQAARHFLERAAKGARGDYYRYRAKARLAAMGYPEAGDHEIPVAPGRPLLRIHPSPSPPSPVPGGQRIERLRFFGRHGMDAGEFEAVAICQEVAGTSGAGAWYRALAEAGFAHTVWQFLRAQDGKKPQQAASRPGLDYPLVYWPQVKAMAREYALDPFLLLAVSRQESTFRAGIESHAGAKGVMQLMPRTARWIAAKMDTVSTDHAGNLGSPMNSLRLGACYLRMMLDRSDDNLVYALASYNGGPGNCDKWRRRYGGADMDRFIECIAFGETRSYVKKVLGNLAAYHALYPELADHFVVSCAASSRPKPPPG